MHGVSVPAWGSGGGLRSTGSQMHLQPLEPALELASRAISLEPIPGLGSWEKISSWWMSKCWLLFSSGNTAATLSSKKPLLRAGAKALAKLCPFPQQLYSAPAAVCTVGWGEDNGC